MEYIAAIIAAIGTIITAWFKYNQYRRDKMTDLKISQIKQDMSETSLRRVDNSAIVFGELWDILYTLDADRVYIIQPHPLGNEAYVSIYFEVKRKGIDGMKQYIHDISMSDMPKFCADLNRNPYIHISDIETQMDDMYARSLFSSHGSSILGDIPYERQPARLGRVHRLRTEKRLQHLRIFSQKQIARNLKKHSVHFAQIHWLSH